MGPEIESFEEEGVVEVFSLALWTCFDDASTLTLLILIFADMTPQARP